MKESEYWSRCGGPVCSGDAALIPDAVRPPPFGPQPGPLWARVGRRGPVRRLAVLWTFPCPPSSDLGVPRYPVRTQAQAQDLYYGRRWQAKVTWPWARALDSASEINLAAEVEGKTIHRVETQELFQSQCSHMLDSVRMMLKRTKKRPFCFSSDMILIGWYRIVSVWPVDSGLRHPTPL